MDLEKLLELVKVKFLRLKRNLKRSKFILENRLVKDEYIESLLNLRLLFVNELVLQSNWKQTVLGF